MNIREKFGNLSQDAKQAIEDFRIIDISEIINVVINSNSNPIINGIVEKWQDILGYDGCIFLAMQSYFRNQNKENKVYEPIDILYLSRMMKDYYVSGVQPEIFEITAICIFYAVRNDLVFHIPWIIDQELKNMYISVLQWSNENIKSLKSDLFYSIIYYLDFCCRIEIEGREDYFKFMSNPVN